MTGVILFRAQPFHNGHLNIVKQAFEDCRKENADLYIFVGSADKVGTERNPLPISFRLMLINGTLRENYSAEELKHIHVISLKDLSDETDNSYNWGRFLFMKMLCYTKDIDMTIYYSDNPAIMLSWFDEEDKWCFKFKFVDRYQDISATKIRKCINSNSDKDKVEIAKMLPHYVNMHTNEIKKYIDNAKGGVIVKNILETRMKNNYENIPKTKLMRRTPVAIRIDGKAFHTFTNNFDKPFDEILIKSMQETTKYLCENIQGCVLGYTQSDEITLILIDYQKLNTSAWFDYEVQKICSVSASMATMAFNKFFVKNVEDWCFECFGYDYLEGGTDNLELTKTKNWTLNKAYWKAIDCGAMFDARCFNIPKEEVTNLIYWRQLDAARNSIQMVGRAYFSHKELENKSNNEIQEMLFTQKGINWNDFPTYQKRGSCVIKTEQGWKIDKNIPLFKGEDREYIDKLIFIDN